jgi:hypothetical protein
MGTKPAESAIAHSETNSAALPRQKLTYQVILRHLVKFRDGARAVLDIFDKQAAGQPPAATEQAQASPSETLPAPRPAPPAAEEKTPLQLRIEQHMDSVDRALIQIRDLNPERKKKAELPPELREKILVKERTIHDIVGAELHFWTAAIENAPLDKFDEIERSWVNRMIRLANIMGVDEEHKEYLAFLQDWASQQDS